MMGTTPDGQPIQTVAWFPIDGATSPKNAFDNLEQAFLKFKADSQRRIIVPAGVPPAPMPKGNGPMPDGMRVV
jgi:hypothetical protein